MLTLLGEGRLATLLGGVDGGTSIAADVAPSPAEYCVRFSLGCP